MRRFIIKVLIFLLIIVACDQVIGLCLDYCYANAKGGTSQRTYHIFNANEDFLIMGASRAAHHYIPSIIEKGIGISCFNCGFGGNGIILNYIILNNILEHHTPKVILYDIAPEYDIYEGDNIKYLAEARPFYHNSIKDLYCQVEPNENLKCISKLYRYNCKMIYAINDFFRGQPDDNKGFVPKYEVMQKDPIRPNGNNNIVYHADSIKLSYFQGFIELCKKKDIKLLFFVSPAYKLDYCKNMYLIHDLLKKYNYKINDFSHDSISTDRTNFADSNHMNENGAKLYSRKIAIFLKDAENIRK